MIQRNFLGHTAATGCESFISFHELTLSPSSGCAGGLVAPTCFGATKPQAHSEDGDIVSSQTDVKPSHPDAAVCPRKFH
jgi:hypothetical protein